VKRLYGIMLLIGMLLALSGCGNSVFNEKDIKEFVMEYKTNQYTVEDPSNPPTAVEIGESVKAYLSKEEYENLIKNRYFHFITVIVENTGKKVELQDVILEKVEENDDGSVDYNYTLEINYYDDHASDIVKKDGQMTIQHDGQYKITRDWEKPTEFEKEAFLNGK
jgi:hypothetical protein